MSAMMPGQPGQDPSQGGMSPGSQPQGAPPMGPISPAQADQQDPNDPTQDVQAGSAQQNVPGGARPVGTIAQKSDQMTDQDPTSEVPATKQEQQEYDQFVSRFLMFISNNKPNGKNLSTHQAAMRQLNDPKVPAAVAIGNTVAMIAMVIVKHAQHQGVNYDPNVLFHANQEICVAVFLMGKAAGMFHNIKPLDPPDANGSYVLDSNDIHVVADAQMQAIRAFGNMMIHQGLLSQEVQDQNKQFWQQQVQREMQSGQVPERVFQLLQQSGAMQHMQTHVENATSAAPAQQGAQQSPPGPPQAQAGAQGGQAGGLSPQAQDQGAQGQPPGAQGGLSPGGQ